MSLRDTIDKKKQEQAAEQAAQEEAKKQHQQRNVLKAVAESTGFDPQWVGEVTYDRSHSRATFAGTQLTWSTGTAYRIKIDDETFLYDYSHPQTGVRLDVTCERCGASFPGRYKLDGKYISGKDSMSEAELEIAKRRSFVEEVAENELKQTHVCDRCEAGLPDHCRTCGRSNKGT